MTQDLFTAAPAGTPRRTMNGKPVHEVPAKSVINFSSGFGHKLLCDSLTFTAGSACAYSCTFCYVEDLMRKNPHWAGVLKKTPDAKFEDVVIRRTGAAARIRQELTDRHGNPKFKTPDDRRVIYGSPLVDVAANMELVRETVEMVSAILELTNWDVRLLSKSNLLPKLAEGLEADQKLNAKGRVIYGVSTGTLSDKLAAAFEVGTTLVSKRIQSLHWLQDNGFRTYGMICPSLPQDDYQKFADQMCDALRAEKLEHVWGEVLNARGDSMTRTAAALRGAGFVHEADSFERVSTDVGQWEHYARGTFLGQAALYRGSKGPDGKPKLRFLQYVTKDSRAWWQARQDNGAILL